MIVYLATWPRCGNSVLRDLIGLNFSDVATDGYMSEEMLNSVFLPSMHSKGWSSLDNNEHIFALGDRRFLSPGWIRWLTPNMRRTLAAETSRYILKTHELPYDHYFDGERVIQMVRHPLAATWSWRQLIVDQRKKRVPTLPDLCQHGAAGVHHGYSQYHERWLQCEATLIRFRYEDHRQDPTQTVLALARFLGVNIANPRIPDWGLMNALSPMRYKAGRIDRWQGAREDADAVWLAAAPAAEALGYAPLS